MSTPKPPPSRDTSVNISGGTVNARDIVGGDVNYNIANNFLGDPAQARNRRDMLDLVTNTWIHGILDQSLYNQVWIELGLQSRPGAVERSWDVHLQMPNQPIQDIPQGTPIIDLFDQLNGAMLILGAPGAGKTTMLLQLARALIARAKEDPLMRIPVVLNLSSWCDPKQTIANWLMSALRTQYQVSKKLAEVWVEQDVLLLLLDGLDEVKSELRDDCVQAINTFRGEHGMMPLVVCSRIADYQALTARLHLRGAVLLQPLTPAQIDAYLDDAGPELTAVRETLEHDATLQDLVQQPLMLSIMTLAYRGVPAAELASERFGTIEARRKHLFDTYIDKMFDRVARTKNELYTPAQTKHWLAWLAKKLAEFGQSIFLLEEIRQSWLPIGTQQILARSIVGLIGAVVCGVGVGLGIGLIAGTGVGLGIGLVVGLAVGLGSALGIGLDDLGLEEPADRLQFSWGISVRSLSVGLVGGLVGGLIGGLYVGLISWLAGGLIVALLGGLVIGLGIGLVGVLLVGLGSIEVETKTTPNEGIRRSTKNAILVGLLFGLVAGISIGLVVGLFFGLTTGLVGGFCIGLGIGLVGGLVFCGFAVINHYTVRFLLSRNDSMPLNYVRFLDYATERILLRKVGGGYIFIHRMLMEHFAALEDNSARS